MKNAQFIVQKLQENGFVAYFAGGFVRDMLLGKISSDIDIVTSAKPDDIEKIFKKTIPVGKKFGVILVLIDSNRYEVATFRSESDYEDKRRPTKIEFSDAKTDALRRDFTINGLFYDPINKKIIDFVGGSEDIKKKTIRFIGDPKDRIGEDNLRLLRAIRFKITLGFQYDTETFAAVRENSNLIKDVSKERVRDELNRIMSSERRHQGLIELSESLILKHVIPELEALKGVPQPIQYHHEGDVFTHTYLALKSLPENAPSHLAWAVLLHDIGKPPTLTMIDKKIVFHNHAQVSAKMAQTIMKRLKFKRFEIYDISYLIENHMKIALIDKMRPGKKLNFVLDPKFSDLIELARADSKGTYPVNLNLVNKLEKEERQLVNWREQTKIHRKKLFFTGDDLIKLGFEPSKKFKKILDEIDDFRISGKIKTKKQAEQYVTKHYKDE